MSTEREIEFSAGGVVVRGDEVAVIIPVKRKADGTKAIALPKGHPDDGESAIEAAVREVREEAGVTGRLIESLGTIEYVYERKGRPCRRCRAPIRGFTQGQRSTYYCPNCQT